MSTRPQDIDNHIRLLLAGACAMLAIIQDGPARALYIVAIVGIIIFRDKTAALREQVSQLEQKLADCLKEFRSADKDLAQEIGAVREDLYSLRSFVERPVVEPLRKKASLGLAGLLVACALVINLCLIGFAAFRLEDVKEFLGEVGTRFTAIREQGTLALKQSEVALDVSKAAHQRLDTELLNQYLTETNVCKLEERPQQRQAINAFSFSQRQRVFQKLQESQMPSIAIESPKMNSIHPEAESDSEMHAQMGQMGWKSPVRAPLSPEE